MASPLKTFVLRRPVTGVICSSPKAPFSTFPAAAAAGPVSCLARSPLRKQCLAPVVSVPKAFARASSGKPDLGSAAQQSLNATLGQNNTHDFAQDPQHALDWNSFFKLRLKRRRYQLLFSITNGMFCGGAGAVVLSTGVAEPIITQIPLDPFMTLGIMTLAFSGLGWLIGPSIGNQFFYALNRKWKKQMTQKEAEFFERIKKHRVDPTNSSAANPVPDFYGEKIQSVAGYRQWLKDQKAFNKKKTANFV